MNRQSLYKHPTRSLWICEIGAPTEWDPIFQPLSGRIAKLSNRKAFSGCLGGISQKLSENQYVQTAERGAKFLFSLNLALRRPTPYRYPGRLDSFVISRRFANTDGLGPAPNCSPEVT